VFARYGEKGVRDGSLRPEDLDIALAYLAEAKSLTGLGRTCIVYRHGGREASLDDGANFRTHAVPRDVRDVPWWLRPFVLFALPSRSFVEISAPRGIVECARAGLFGLEMQFFSFSTSLRPVVLQELSKHQAQLDNVIQQDASFLAFGFNRDVPGDSAWRAWVGCGSECPGDLAAACQAIESLL